MSDTAVTPTGRHPVVFVGAATMDSIALVPGYPGADDRVLAEELTSAGGGPAATAAVTAARLGVPAAFVGTVGDDADGERILADLRDEGVDVSGVTVATGRRSAASVIVVDRSRGTRAISARPGPPVDTTRGVDLVRGAEWVHADHLGWPAVRALVDPALATRPRLSVDAGNPIPGFAPDGVDLFVPTVVALRRVHGERAVEDLLRAAHADGARRVVATDGGRGSYGADPSRPTHHAPGVAVDVLSTLGAGDVFHGALLAAHVRSDDLPAALAYANVVAALACTGLDGRSAVPDHERVLALLPDHDPAHA
ncbi:ribokinase [Phycicoccus sp. CSK15P-2]|uniref:carbohydrate kinase family protein n=1 Tax=Phycicoccus sp. CSK15P-2 TaxID=2807627 RepID=UPI001951BF7A|nr:PfkB family carbohydrate kinase [Phycicoccus sp. CSK15P-2]MBM6404877.1 ribokinase [Phycicoccus sp. CSK15P-2]